MDIKKSGADSHNNWIIVPKLLQPLKYVSASTGRGDYGWEEKQGEGLEEGDAFSYSAEDVCRGKHASTYPKAP